MNLKAVIMAGGEGTRLRPITCTMPKPLVPVAGRPVIDYCVELLQKHEITDISTTLFYLGNMIEKHLGSGENYGVKITHSVTPIPLGTAGSVRFAASDTNSPVLVISGDTLTDCDISHAYEQHKSRGACATIVLKQVSSPGEYGVALMDSDGRITRFYEKPSSGEVFSDLANTGIYILEPEVISMIPTDRAFDFSLDLFPLLLEKGMPVYGYEMQGYWCDIGGIKQYMQAQRDVLDRKTAFEPKAGNHGGVYIEPGAHISENARISPPCYISAGAEIGENVRLESYSVIGKGVKIYENADIKRSVIMHDSVIHENTELRGAIICPNVTMDRYASAFESSVVGEHSVIGQSSSISCGASVWPDKHIKDNSSVCENIVWGTGKRMEFTDTGVSGYCDTDISPETALRVGSSFASTLSPFGQIGIASDGRRVTSMLKRAATAGVISQGVDVMSFPHMPYSLFSFTVRHLGLTGGIYISTATGDSHSAAMTLCDHTGTAVQSSVRRKVDKAFSMGEQKPVTHREIGIVEEITGTVKAYEAELLRNINCEKLHEKPITLLLDIPAYLYEIAAPVLLRQGVNVLSADTERGMNMQMKIAANNADIGCYISEQAHNPSPAFMLKSGKSVQGSALLALFAYDALTGGRHNRFTVPVTLPDEYARMLMDKGAQLITAPEQWHSWQRASYVNNTVLPEFFDPLAAILRMTVMCAEGKAEKMISDLPETYKQEYTVPCNDFGKVLRNLSNEVHGEDTETIDGIKIHRDNGWVIVKAANNGIAACRIICGSFKEEYANDLSGMYIDKLKRIIAKE
ncbi:MAG: NTP transferase domain-containing protein [Clostridia bacterium]|nr:NTP transferase domain-containing protein [Clostridia bacterium]